MAITKLSGGKKLEEALKLLGAKAKNAAVLNVGFMSDATYPDKNHTPVAAVAATNEFGRPDHNQPPRPFFRGMITKESPHWGKGLGDILKSEDYDAARSLRIMGKEIEGELVQSIQDFTTPGLAESTKKAKGFDKPLIDTDVMWRSVDSFVEET